MSVPSAFTNVLTNAAAFDVWRWLEIEGIPSAYGNISRSSSFFSSRAAADQFTGIVANFKTTPDQFEAQLDVLEAVAKYAAQVEFSLVDLDGTQTLWAGSWDVAEARELSSAVSAFGATISYGGAAASTSLYPTGGGTIYIGNETITYTAHNTGTKQFTGCSRGRYKSTAQAWGVGALLSHKPYLFYGRRVWYYQALKAKDPSFATPTQADALLRFSGTVENLRLDDRDVGVYVLQCVSLEREFARPVFRDLRQVKDTTKRGMVGDDFSKPGMRFLNQPNANESSDRLYGPDVMQYSRVGAPYFENGDRYLFRIDDEFVMFLAETSAAPGALQMVARACLGTEVEEHSAGFVAKEVAWCARYIANSNLPEHLYTRFNSPPTNWSRAAGDHPLIVLLCLMLSTGQGTNTPGGLARNYDILPKEWGLGIPYSRIDVAGIELLANETRELALNGFWEQEMPFGELAKQALAPFGMYSLTLPGGQWTIRKLRPPLPNEVTTTITKADIISKSSLGWDGNLAGLVQEVEYLYNRDLKSNRWLNSSVFINGNAQQYAQDKGRRLSYQLPHIYSRGPTPIAGRPPLGGMPNVELFLQERLDFFRQGYTMAPPIINMRCRYDKLTVAVGSLVTVTEGRLPVVQSGVRGPSGQIMRVLKVVPDEGSKTVELTLQDTGFGAVDFGYINFAAKVLARTGSEQVELADNAVMPEYDTFGNAQYDALVTDLNGDQHEWIARIMNDADAKLLAVSADFGDTAILDIVGYTSPPTATVDWSPAGALAWLDAGAFLIPVSTVAQVDFLRNNFSAVFMSEGTNALEDGEDPYKLYP